MLDKVKNPENLKDKFEVIKRFMADRIVFGEMIKIPSESQFEPGEYTHWDGKEGEKIGMELTADWVDRPGSILLYLPHSCGEIPPGKYMLDLKFDG